MILADKIIEERKKLGYSQEELAQILEVSRQSVSKWEGAQSVPDISRIIKMSEVFGVSTDYLLRDDYDKESEGVEIKTSDLKEEALSQRKLRRVSLDEAAEFIKTKKELVPFIAFGVDLCILSPIILILLSCLVDEKIISLSENLVAVFGIAWLLIMVAGGVFLFITMGYKEAKFKDLTKVEIETEYGVDGMARETREAAVGKRNLKIAIGVVLCILSPIPLITFSSMELNDGIVVLGVCILLILVACAVNLFINSSAITKACDVLLQEGDYTVAKKKIAPTMARIGEIYWLIATAIYLAWSFATNSWHMTWMVWPVAGLLYGVLVAVAHTILGAEN